MRRTLVGLTATIVLTGTFLVLPVYAAPLPGPEPVATSTDEVPLGSVEDPAPAVEVQEGTTEPVSGVPSAAPTLTLTRADVDEFSLVGVTWAHDPEVTDTLVQVRVRTGDGAWGEWTEVTTETADQSTTARTGAELRGGTSPLWTGPSTGVQVELVTRSGAQPTDVQLDLVDPGESEADAALDAPEITDTAHAAAAMPAVYSRGQWGADERIRTWGPQYAPTIKATTLHHTADSNAYGADQVPAIMRSIYRYHAVSLGWGDIGYHVVVDKFGRLWEGRAGGLASTVMGAHAGGFNTSTFGVSMLGNYDVVPVPQATVDSVAAIIAWKFSLFGVNPSGTTVLTSSGGGTSRYASGTRVTLPTIFGHRQVGSTACPGRYGYARLAEIRNKVVSRLAAAGPSGGGQVATRYAELGGAGGVLGSATSPITCGLRDGGCFQDYVRGAIHWSPSTGARMTKGWIAARWAAGNRENGSLGYPTSEEIALAGGAYQTFQGGAVYASAAGAFVVKGWVGDRWRALGAERGFLGYPVSEEVPASGGVSQSFQGGVVYSSPGTGAHEVHGWVLDKWTAMGREKGLLGFPTSDEIKTAAGAYNTFAGGAIHSTPATGPREVHGAIGRRWIALGAGKAAVGYPVADERRAADGKGAFSEFSNGVVYYRLGLGAHDVTGVLADKWSALGGISSFLGYPTADVQFLAGGGSVATFQGGSVYGAPGATQAFEVHGWIRDLWTAKGAQAGVLGYPTSDEQKAPDGVGVYQTFQRGVVYSAPETGAREVHGAVADKWRALGGLAPFPGPPVTNELSMPDRVGKAWVFGSGAAIYTSPATGPFEVHGWIRDLYSSLNGEQSFLGYPVSDETPILEGRAALSRFQGGHIYSSAKTGAREVHGAILTRYLQLGGPTSQLGLPTTNEYGVRGGRRSDFQGGSITYTTSTGAITVTLR